MQNKRILFLIALLSTFPPLSTDMYLPALPLLREEWQQPMGMVNLTLIGFFVSYCVFLLVYGPISDRYGRRGPLMAGISIYIVASAVCAVSNSIEMMIVCRVLQGAGAAAGSALSLAMCRDLFDAASRARIMAHLAIIMALAPMLAPIIGSWVIYLATWHWVFVIQVLLGTIAVFGVYRMEEPLKTFTTTSPLHAFGVYFRLMQNRRYISLMLGLSLLVFPTFAFIAGSPEIYMTEFGFSERRFGIFFGANAVFSMVGSFLFGHLSRCVSMEKIIAASFLGIALAGFWMLFWPLASALRLTLPMCTMAFFFGLSRPPSNNLTLEQVSHDIGAASSLMVFTFMIFGATSMGIISMDWPDKISVIGIMAATGGSLTLVFWLRFKSVFMRAMPARRK
ncbi:multidrug effflux MFS transporter [Desulfosarcina sp. OttesenSCG-928-A07]|nr:multidrug effflux MFS transporter [Desulfosarcina sp. OttesenSCG-928-A07]